MTIFFFSFFENNENHFKRNGFLISPRLIREPVLNTPKIYYENEHDFNDRNQKHNFGSSKFNKEIENDLKSNLNDIMKENPTQNAVYFRNFKSEGSIEKNGKMKYSSNNLEIKKNTKIEDDIKTKSICNRAKVIEVNSKFWPEKIFKDISKIENSKKERNNEIYRK